MWGRGVSRLLPPAEMAGSFPFSRLGGNQANQPISFPIYASRSAIKQAAPLPYSNCSSFHLFELAVEPENPSSLPSLGSHLPTPHRRNWLAVGCLRVVWKLPAPFVYLLNLSVVLRYLFICGCPYMPGCVVDRVGDSCVESFAVHPRIY
jgi:hypothetical protein